VRVCVCVCVLPLWLCASPGFDWSSSLSLVSGFPSSSARIPVSSLISMAYFISIYQPLQSQTWSIKDQKIKAEKRLAAFLLGELQLANRRPFIVPIIKKKKCARLLCGSVSFIRNIHPQPLFWPCAPGSSTRVVNVVSKSLEAHRSGNKVLMDYGIESVPARWRVLSAVRKSL
jgi:hypothetical protein